MSSSATSLGVINVLIVQVMIRYLTNVHRGGGMFSKQVRHTASTFGVAPPHTAEAVLAVGAGGGCPLPPKEQGQKPAVNVGGTESA